MPVQRNAIEVVRLSSYNPNTLKDDISLIKLAKAIDFSDNVQPIPLPPRSQATTTLLNNILTVSGFGLTTSNQVSTTLQYTEVIGISNDECRGVYGSIIIPTMLCTRGYPSTNAGSCSGQKIFEHLLII